MGLRLPVRHRGWWVLVAGCVLLSLITVRVVRPHGFVVEGDFYSGARRILQRDLPPGTRRQTVGRYLDYYRLRYLTWGEYLGLTPLRYDTGRSIETMLESRAQGEWSTGGPRAVFKFNARGELVDVCFDNSLGPAYCL